MKGSCPECSRTYEISDEFLAMGGKAKCPHCMLDLDFAPAGSAEPADAQPRSRRHPKRAPTRIAPDLRPAAPVAGPEEVDAFCDACGKRFKIDAEYLRMGGAAACPHCAQSLRIDPATDPRQPASKEDDLSTDRHDDEPGQEPYGQTGGFGLGDLGLDAEAGEAQDGAAPVSVDDTREPHEGEPALETEDTALPTEVMNSPFVAARELAEPAPRAEPEPSAEPSSPEISDGGFDLPPMQVALQDRTLADQTVAEHSLDEMSQDLGALADPATSAADLERAVEEGAGFQESLDGLSTSLEGELTAAEGAEETEAGEEPAAAGSEEDGGGGGDQPGESPAEVAGPGPGQEAGQAEAGRSEARQPLDLDAAPAREITGETVEVDSLAAQAASGDDSGVFSGLASNDDWAEAAQRWARSGFKAEEMPGFIKGSGGATIPDSSAEASPPTVAVQPPRAQPKDSPPTVAAVPPSAGPTRTTPHGAVLAEARPDTVEVSDADILTLSESEIQEVPEAPPVGGWAARAAEEIRAQKPAEQPRVPSRPRLQAAWLGKLANPPVLAAVLGLVVLAVVTCLWLFLGRTEDVGSRVFPAEGLKNPIVPAADPSPYRTRDEALRHYGLGNRLAFAGDAEGAIAEYQAAQRIDPGFPHPHRALGAMFAALGKTELAVQSYESYLRLSPRGPDAEQVRQIVQKSKGQ
ncbi:MAG TPA: hypothetical protein PK668_18570 [Myxococcota bacterium]|nr:hypothetical protein [Myxococcota bacterium]HRY96556.1 hypothetical protein [Myxococcota bacterium]HSA22794.1 hypothetical protein [Myxococcota bacterium]